MMKKYCPVRYGKAEKFIPNWKGKDKFGGQVIHASDYLNLKPSMDKDVPRARDHAAGRLSRSFTSGALATQSGTMLRLFDVRSFVRRL